MQRGEEGRGIATGGILLLVAAGLRVVSDDLRGIESVSIIVAVAIDLAIIAALVIFSGAIRGWGAVVASRTGTAFLLALAAVQTLLIPAIWVPWEQLPPEATATVGPLMVLLPAVLALGAVVQIVRDRVLPGRIRWLPAIALTVVAATRLIPDLWAVSSGMPDPTALHVVLTFASLAEIGALSALGIAGILVGLREGDGARNDAPPAGLPISARRSARGVRG